MRRERETTGAAPPHNANAVVSRAQGQTRRFPHTGVTHQSRERKGCEPAIAGKRGVTGTGRTGGSEPKNVATQQ